MALEPGTRFGPYDVGELLGRGGMGEVYRATDTRLHREVALKVLPHPFAGDAERLSRFQREARVLASINHPLIATIHGVERTDGVDALVLEFVDGPTLAERLAAGAIPVDEALPLAQQIAEALEAAHEHGIIHRDLKPANIKLRTDGTVKILDFGLAKPADALAIDGRLNGDAMQSPTITSPAMMTGAGVILGTAAYMAPEQAKGKSADIRSDAWAFGCVLYEMLTGQRAFPGEDISDTLASVLRAEPDWTALPIDTPESIHRLLRRALEKDRRRRLPHLGIARLEIEDARRAPAAATAHGSLVDTRVRWRHLGGAVALSVLLAAVSGWAAWVWKPAPPTPVVRFSIQIPEGQALPAAGGAQTLAVSPAGDRLVYIADNRLYLRSLDQHEAQAISGTEKVGGGLSNPVFSPDGESIAFYSFVPGSGASLNRIPVSGGSVVRLCAVRTTSAGITWTARGIVFGQGAGGIIRVSADGGTPEQLVTMNAGEDASFPVLLQDGRAVLYTLTSGTDAERWDAARLVVHRLADGHRSTLLENAADGRVLPTGHLVFAHSGTLFATAFDEEALAVSGPRIAIVEGVRRGSVTGAAHYSVSETGLLVYSPGPPHFSVGIGTRELATIDRLGRVERLEAPPAAYGALRVSPNGKYLAASVLGPTESMIWIHDLSGVASPRRLTFGGSSRYPIWSPDGQRIAFESTRDGDAGIFWQRADGLDTAVRLTKAEPGESHIPESWLPDGSLFTFSVLAAQGASLHTYSLKDNKVAVLTPVRSPSPFNSEFSPDGRWLAYTLRAPGSLPSVMVEPFPPTGAQFQISQETAHHPVWSRDGKELSYRLSAAQQVVVAVTMGSTFVFGPPQLLRGEYPTTPFGRPRNYDMMPAGDRFIVPADVVEPAQARRPTSPMASVPRRLQVVVNWFQELRATLPAGR